MRPSKIRLKRRAQHSRLMDAGRELECAASNYVSWQSGSNAIDGRAGARSRLFGAAIAFAAEVDGEESEKKDAKVTPIAKAAR